MKAAQRTHINLDGSNLKFYSNKLYWQLVRYPQEIIPLMDHTITEVFLDLFEDVNLNGESLTVSL